MFGYTRRALQTEDVLLFVWLSVVTPLLARTLAGTLGRLNPWDLRPGIAGARGFGLLFLLAALCGAVCLATRAPGAGNPWADLRRVENYARLPMLAVTALMLAYGLDLLGTGLSDLAPPVTLLFAVVVGLLSARLLTIPFLWRRVLMTPVILLCTWQFSATMRSLFDGFDLRALLGGPPPADLGVDVGRPGLLAIIALLFGVPSLVGYVIFVYAPRQVASRGGSWRQWALRYLLYLAGLLLNIPALQRL